MRTRALLSSALALALLVPSAPALAENTTSGLLGNQIAVAARQDFLKQLAKSSKRPANLSYKVDPSFNKSLLHQVMVDTQVSAGFWASVRPVDQKVKVYIAQKTVEVCGSEIRIYSWRELGFTGVC